MAASSVAATDSVAARYPVMGPVLLTDSSASSVRAPSGGSGGSSGGAGGGGGGSW